MSRGLLLVGHGSHLNAESSAPVRRHAAAIRELGAFDEVRMGFWKEEPSLSRALDAFVADDITVVPVFMSAGYFTNEVIPREMGLSGTLSEVRDKMVRYTPPIGSHPALAQVIVQRALEAGGKAGDTLAVLGHGTPRNPESERNIYEQAERAKALGPFREVVTVFLDQDPNMRDLLAMTPTETVVIVPLFVAEGWHVGETIPEDLALDGPETRRGGRHVRYAGPVGTHPSVVDVILELAGDTPAARPGTSPSKRQRPSLWRASGRPDRLGQLEITGGADGFLVRAQAGEPELWEWPLDAAEEYVRVDDWGRYRPLTGAPTLSSGAVVRARNEVSLGAFLETVYPLALHHRAQARAGELRIVALDEVLGRQSGRYGTAAELSSRGSRLAVEALCASSCLRTPVWPGPSCATDLDPAQAEIPCPEPCSVFVSLCREAALWEKEPPAASPVEPEVPFAAFEEPGNRVREQYLALRFGDGVPRDG